MAKKPATPTIAAQPRPASSIWLPALEPLVPVDDDEELVLEAVELEAELELEVVLLPLTASQISVMTFWVAGFSKSAMGRHVYIQDAVCQDPQVRTGNVGDRARRADAAARVARNGGLVLTLARVVGAAAVRRTGALGKALETARWQLRGNAGNVGGGGRGGQAEEAGEDDG